MKTWKVSLLIAARALLLGLGTGTLSGAGLWVVLCLVVMRRPEVLGAAGFAGLLGAAVGLMLGLVGAIALAAYLAVMHSRQPTDETARGVVAVSIAAVLVGSILAGLVLRVEARLLVPFLIGVALESWLCGRSLARIYRNYVGGRMVTR
jgi:hypothetical protein